MTLLNKSSYFNNTTEILSTNFQRLKGDFAKIYIDQILLRTLIDPHNHICVNLKKNFVLISLKWLH